MIALGIALALGFIIGDTIRNLALALLACVVAGALLTGAFILLPYAWGRAPLRIEQLAEPLLIETIGATLVACIGLFFGRRRAGKGWGKP